MRILSSKNRAYLIHLASLRATRIRLRCHYRTNPPSSREPRTDVEVTQDVEIAGGNGTCDDATRYDFVFGASTSQRLKALMTTAKGDAVSHPCFRRWPGHTPLDNSQAINQQPAVAMLLGTCSNGCIQHRRAAVAAVLALVRTMTEKGSAREHS